MANLNDILREVADRLEGVIALIVVELDGLQWWNIIRQGSTGMLFQVRLEW